MKPSSFSLTKLLFACVLAVIGITAGVSRAGTVRRVPLDYATIQAAVDAAASGDTVLLAPGTYKGDGNRGINFGSKSLVLMSEENAASTIINCEDVGTGISVNGGQGNETEIAGVTIRNAQRGFLLSGVAIRVSRCVIDSCGAGGYPGSGVWSSGASVFEDCEFLRNRTWDSGAAVYCEGSPIFNGCLFSGNFATRSGGAMWIKGGARLSDCVFFGNTSANGGGGAISSGGSPVIERAEFVGNVADLFGGAFNGSADSIVESEFIGNRTQSPGTRGGAVTLQGGYVGKCVFADNTSYGGAALYVGNTMIEECTIVGNSTTDGAIYVWGYAAMQCRRSVIAFNGVGEAIYCEEGASATVECSDLYENMGGDWVGCIAGQCGVNGNISADPLFCDVGDGNFYLQSTSPCLRSPCGAMGAYGLGCLGEQPVISRITDVGNDQGRQVRLVWLRSLYDAPGDTVNITGYAVYRREDAYRTAPRESEPAEVPALLGWDYIASHPASGDSVYQLVVPTLCDSTKSAGMCWSVFLVRAMTDDVFTYFDSEPDSGYSLDNLAPSPPAGFVVAYNTVQGNVLSWEECDDLDFDYFKVYRGVTPDFTPTSENLIHTTSAIDWTDVAGTYSYYYKITSVDFSGNESGTSSPDATTAAPDEAVPRETTLYQNVPNPFNPSTTITFAVAEPGRVALAIYDARGAIVRELLDRWMEPGVGHATWDGKDEHGLPASSGVYFCRLSTESKELTKKLTLLK